MFEDFRSVEDTSAGRTGGTSLNAGRIRGGGGEGLGGKRCYRSVLLISVGQEAFSSVGTRSGALPAAIFLASQTDRALRLGQELRSVDSFGRVDNLEICVSSHTGPGRRGLILSHETGGMVINASWLRKFWSPPRFRVGGWAFGWGVGGDAVSDLCKAVIEP